MKHRVDGWANQLLRTIAASSLLLVPADSRLMTNELPLSQKKRIEGRPSVENYYL